MSVINKLFINFINLPACIFVLKFLSCLTLFSLIKFSLATDKYKVGKIAEIDVLIMMYGQQIHESKGLESLLEDVQVKAKQPGVIKEHVDYYIKIIKTMIEEKSAKFLKEEQSRLNSIITSASYHGDGDSEISYALVRRNILESFTESSAEYLMFLIKENLKLGKPVDLKSFTTDQWENKNDDGKKLNDDL